MVSNNKRRHLNVDSSAKWSLMLTICWQANENWSFLMLWSIYKWLFDLSTCNGDDLCTGNEPADMQGQNLYLQIDHVATQRVSWAFTLSRPAPDTIEWMQAATWETRYEPVRRRFGLACSIRSKARTWKRCLCCLERITAVWCIGSQRILFTTYCQLTDGAAKEDPNAKKRPLLTASSRRFQACSTGLFSNFRSNKWSKPEGVFNHFIDVAERCSPKNKHSWKCHW